MTENGRILRSVAAPDTILAASPALTKGAGGLALMVFLFSLNGLYMILMMIVAQVVASIITMRDPDIMESIAAHVRVRRFPWFGVGVPSFYSVTGNRYVP